jgi:hypothetical protein
MQTPFSGWRGLMRVNAGFQQTGKLKNTIRPLLAGSSDFAKRLKHIGSLRWRY